jgi:hypothetical protein
VQFLLFDVSATLVFLAGYLAVVALHERRTVGVMAAMSGAQVPTAPRGERKPKETPKAPATEPCCREWPRLSAPR